MEASLESHWFITLLTAPWFLVLVGGTIVLGIAIAYGVLRNRQRTTREKLQTEAATRDIYHKEDRGEDV